MLEGKEETGSCERKGEDCDCCGCGREFCCAEKRRERVCSVDCVNVRAADTRVRLGGYTVHGILVGAVITVAFSGSGREDGRSLDWVLRTLEGIEGHEVRG